MVFFQNQQITEIFLPVKESENICAHCWRKLNGKYFLNEVKEKQAYGLVAGKIQGSVLSIGLVIPLYSNSRINGLAKEYMDYAVCKYAIPGSTPINERAWSADPLEVKNALNVFQRDGLDLVGAYHMHHVNSWKGEEPLDEPTDLDRYLGNDTGLLTFIVAITNIDSNRIRAFYEGCREQEVKIHIK